MKTSQPAPELHHLLRDLLWAYRWLHTPANELPGKLSHQICQLERARAWKELERHYPRMTPTLQQYLS